MRKLCTYFKPHVWLQSVGILTLDLLGNNPGPVGESVKVMGRKINAWSDQSWGGGGSGGWMKLIHHSYCCFMLLLFRGVNFLLLSGIDK